MRVAYRMPVIAGLLIGAAGWCPLGAQEPTAAGAATAGPDSPAAVRTRTRLLPVKVSVDFKDVPLRDALKELAAQVEMQAERPVMWTYAAETVPAGLRVTYACRDKPLEQVLDELFRAHSLGYVILSQDDQPKDGWVRVTPNAAERGTPAGAPTAPADADEANAAARLAAAKELLARGKAADARLILMVVTTKYPKTKAAAEAKALLEKPNP
jgi:hypothetical protein